jgi:Uma2 family endonuclease
VLIMAAQTKTRVTTAEFLTLPETMQRTELIDGEIFMAPAPELRHQDDILCTAFTLRRLAPQGKMYISPVDVVLDEYNTVQPDVLWIAPESQCVPEDGKRLRGAPDLVVEVLSPGTARRDRREKFALYEKHGAREYWMMDAEAQFVEVWVRGESGFVRLGIFAPDERFTSPLIGVVVVNDLFGL